MLFDYRNGATVAARVHVPDTYDVPDTDDADADTDDDAGPCEDIVVLAKTHRGVYDDMSWHRDRHSSERFVGFPVFSVSPRGSGKAKSYLNEYTLAAGRKGDPKHKC